jgi:hypothetical protein
MSKKRSPSRREIAELQQEITGLRMDNILLMMRVMQAEQEVLALKALALIGSAASRPRG